MTSRDKIRPPRGRDQGRSMPPGPHPSVTMREFPYPYIAALALGCDPDDLRTREEFLQLMRFLDTTDATSMGRGLGLEASCGFYFYDGCGECDFTLFTGTSSEPSANAELIEDLIRSGHVDSIHGYGDFSEGGFERHHAVQALGHLAARGLRVEVWANHGGAANTQQIGRLPRQRGDDPGATEYHTDLLVSHGVRFVEKYDIVHTVGQDARSRPIVDRLKQAREIMAYGLRGTDWKARAILSNRLLEPYVLGDGQTVYSFKRFVGARAGLERAGARELAKQISESVLSELEAKCGYLIVYTHPWRDTTPGGVLPAGTQDALRVLAREHEAGRIYVTTARKLLVYNLVRRGLAWHARTAGKGLEIEVTGLGDAVSGPRTPTLAELQGVTFYTPCPESTRIYIGDRETGNLTTNPPDDTGRPSVSVPVTRQTFPATHRSD